MSSKMSHHVNQAALQFHSHPVDVPLSRVATDPTAYGLLSVLRREDFPVAYEIDKAVLGNSASPSMKLRWNLDAVNVF